VQHVGLQGIDPLDDLRQQRQGHREAVQRETGLENVDIIAAVMCEACPALTLAITSWSSPNERCQLTRQRRIPAAQLAHASQP
jgi:hypothetical protein